MLTRLALLPKNTRLATLNRLLKPSFAVATQARAAGSRMTKGGYNMDNADGLEDFGNIMSSLSAKLREKEAPVKVDDPKPFIYKQKGNVIYIRGAQGDWSSHSIIKVGEDQYAFVLSLEENQTTALLLDQRKQMQGETLESRIEAVDLAPKFGFGPKLQQAFSTNMDTSSLKETQEVNLSKLRFKKSPFRREIGSKQLTSGFMRLDLADPLQQGNFIVFKGNKQASGKHMVVSGIIKNFLEESPDHRVVFSGLNTQQAYQILGETQRKDQICVISSGPTNDGLGGSIAEQYFTPFAALKFIQQHIESSKGKPKILFVAGDLMLHSFREKEIFDLAKQPFSPLNMANEIQSMTGLTSSYELTSIVVMDSDVSPLMFKQDENTFEVNMDSMADKIVSFDSQESKLTRGLMPQMGLSFPKIINRNIQSPYLRTFVGDQFRGLLESVQEAETQHNTRSEYKLDEDPWDNYLYFDSRPLVKLICHTEPLSLSEVVLLTKFILHTFKEETISQYSCEPKLIIKELFEFARSFEVKGAPVSQASKAADESTEFWADSDDDILDSEDEEQVMPMRTSSSIFTKIDGLLALKSIEGEVAEKQILSVEEDLQRLMKMFYLQMKMKGLLKDFRDDYFV